MWIFQSEVVVSGILAHLLVLTISGSNPLVACTAALNITTIRNPVMIYCLAHMSQEVKAWYVYDPLVYYVGDWVYVCMIVASHAGPSKLLGLR